MTSRKVSVRTAARERARQAKARADAERLEREKAVERAQEAFFEARLQRDEALAEVARFETEMSHRVRAILDLGEPVGRVARLCELTETEVRSLRRRAPDQGADRTAEVQPPPEGKSLPETTPVLDDAREPAREEAAS